MAGLSLYMTSLCAIWAPIPELTYSTAQQKRSERAANAEKYPLRFLPSGEERKAVN